ncbi:MAG: hypothetical protein HY816_23445 [Candidatus Wallbacteria bacterium]|nr:hypothetical protein [Candidatus Wallbacteria bacterium]
MRDELAVLLRNVVSKACVALGRGGGPPTAAWLLVLTLATGTGGAAASPLAAVGYRLNSPVAAEGDAVVVRFALAEPAHVTLTAFDADHARAATVAASRVLPAGEVTLTWPCTGDAGGPVAGGVYYFVLEATSEGGSCRYDPALEGGGEPIPMEFGQEAYDTQTRQLRFRLDRPGWVRARAGVHSGPLLATPLDWRPLPAGDHRIGWDGKDDSGVMDLAAHPGLSIVMEAFGLPPGAVIVAGPARAGSASKAGGADARALERLTRVRKTATARGVASQYLQPSAQRISPGFTLSWEGGGLPVLASKAESLPLRISADPDTVARLAEQRFEIVTFVDFQRVGEEELGYLPYTVQVPASALAKGEHTVSVSLVTFGGQASTRSLKVQAGDR